ncbi:MAG: hypothetical protein IPN36_06730 [Bacteroidetes bacterium]|nr:hypothetical protein [Bacteroidota bacterium]MBL0095086.1 hypothetical protein [Bacteroidota bacterium]
MKKIILSVLLMLACIAESQAQKTAKEVVTELCTSSNYPTNSVTMSIAFNLTGHTFPEPNVTASFGYGDCITNITNIKTKTTTGLSPVTYKAVECWSSAAGAPAMKYFQIRDGKYTGAKFQLTFTNGALSGATTPVGNIKIIYSDGTTKTISIPSNLTVRGTSLTTGYTMTGKVTGEFGEEQLTFIIRKWNFPG